eukprot:1158184-Pelagomonas_calceolata.AAC.3
MHGKKHDKYGACAASAEPPDSPPVNKQAKSTARLCWLAVSRKPQLGYKAADNRTVPVPSGSISRSLASAAAWRRCACRPGRGPECPPAYSSPPSLPDLHDERLASSNCESLHEKAGGGNAGPLTVFVCTGSTGKGHSAPLKTISCGVLATNLHCIPASQVKLGTDGKRPRTEADGGTPPHLTNQMLSLS